MEPHPNADRLAVVRVDDYTVCVAKDMWEDGQKAAYIPIESIVDTDMPMFSFLKKNKRFQKIKTCKLRGVYSQGVLIPVDNSYELGTDLAEHFNVRHDDPEAKFEANCKSSEIAGPSSWAEIPKYDVDALLKYGSDWFNEDEDVMVTEKVHGTNFRCLYCADTGKFYVGSRKQWLAEQDGCLYWKIFRNCPELATFCKENPQYMFRGEGYGMQKHYTYGITDGKYGVVGFDLMYKNRTYVSSRLLRNMLKTYDIPQVPLVGVYGYNLELMQELAEGPSLLGGSSPREGIVVKPLKECQSDTFDRVILKLIGSGYKG